MVVDSASIRLDSRPGWRGEAWGGGRREDCGRRGVEKGAGRERWWGERSGTECRFMRVCEESPSKRRIIGTTRGVFGDGERE